MTRQLVKHEHDSATDVDFPESARIRQAARHWGSSVRRPPSLKVDTASPSRDIERAVRTTDSHPWALLRKALAGHPGADVLEGIVAGHWLAATDDPLTTPPAARSSAEDTRPAERRRRYARLLKRLDAWAADTSGFDERVAPVIEEALRETAPRHFPDE